MINARKLLFHLRRRIHWGAGLISRSANFRTALPLETMPVFQALRNSSPLNPRETFREERRRSASGPGSSP
jgi:hypothetical protein